MYNVEVVCDASAASALTLACCRDEREQEQKVHRQKDEGEGVESAKVVRQEWTGTTGAREKKLPVTKRKNCLCERTETIKENSLLTKNQMTKENSSLILLKVH